MIAALMQGSHQAGNHEPATAISAIGEVTRFFAGGVFTWCAFGFGVFLSGLGLIAWTAKRFREPVNAPHASASTPEPKAAQ